MKLINLVIDEELDFSNDGVHTISLVENPAIQEKAYYFSSIDKNEIKFNDEMGYIISPILIPDKKILREDNGDYYEVVMNKETIRKISESFMLNGYMNNFNIEHGQYTSKAKMIYNWIVDHKEDKINTLYGYDLPVGSWVCMIKLLDDKLKDMFKSGTLNGLSIEGYFTEKILNSMVEKNENKNKLYTKNKQMEMTKLSQMLKDIQKSLQLKYNEDLKKKETFGNQFLNDGETMIYYDGETIDLGTELLTWDEETETFNPLPSGEYILENGIKLIVDESGIVQEIVEAEVEAEAEAEVEAEDENPETETEGEVESVEDEIENVDKFIDEIKEAVEHIKEIVKVNDEKFSKKFAEIDKKIDEIKKSPAVELKEVPKTKIEISYLDRLCKNVK
jgi:hypothetical protein